MSSEDKASIHSTRTTASEPKSVRVSEEEEGNHSLHSTEGKPIPEDARSAHSKADSINPAESLKSCTSFTITIESCTTDSPSETESEYRKRHEPVAGYPAISHFMNSHPDFLVFRRFGELSVRTLLYLQDELAEIEEKLSRHEAEVGIERGRRTDEDEERGRLMDLAKVKLQEYKKALKTHEFMITFEHPPDRQIRSVANYLQNQVNDDHVPLDEATFINHPHDLIALHPISRQTLFRLLDSSDIFNRLFPKTKGKLHSGVVHYSQTASAAFYRFLALMINWVYVGIFLITPIILLAGPFVEMSIKWKVLFVGFAVIVFSAALSLFTAARDWEMLCGAAAYSAVLVVFLGNGAGAG